MASGSGGFRTINRMKAGTKPSAAKQRRQKYYEYMNDLPI